MLRAALRIERVPSALFRISRRRGESRRRRCRIEEALDAACSGSARAPPSLMRVTYCLLGREADAEGRAYYAVAHRGATAAATQGPLHADAVAGVRGPLSCARVPPGRRLPLDVQLCELANPAKWDNPDWRRVLRELALPAERKLAMHRRRTSSHSGLWGLARLGALTRRRRCAERRRGPRVTRLLAREPRAARRRHRSYPGEWEARPAPRATRASSRTRRSSRRSRIGENASVVPADGRPAPRLSPTTPSTSRIRCRRSSTSADSSGAATAVREMARVLEAGRRAGPGDRVARVGPSGSGEDIFEPDEVRAADRASRRSSSSSPSTTASGSRYTCHARQPAAQSVRDAAHARRHRRHGVHVGDGVRAKSRHAVTGTPMSNWLTDGRSALRALRASKWTTIAAVLTLALGTGANMAVVAVAYGVLLRPLPFPNPTRLVRITTERSVDGNDFGIALSEFEEWQRRLTTVESVAAYSRAEFTVRGVGDPEVVQASAVTGDFFRVLSVPASTGQPFAEDRAASTVVASDRYGRRLAGSGAVVGRQITLGSLGMAIAAVMPPPFAFPDDHIELWVPARAMPKVGCLTRRAISGGFDLSRACGRVRRSTTCAWMVRGCCTRLLPACPDAASRSAVSTKRYWDQLGPCWGRFSPRASSC